MVWSMSYCPKPDRYPLLEVVEGNKNELELENVTDDGGIGLRMSRSFSGRRAKVESVPKVIRWKSERKLLDYEGAYIGRSVSDHFRALIEEIEPGIHQFEPISYVGKDNSLLEQRWFWQICNRIDSVHRELSNWVLVGTTSWRPPPKPEDPHMVFDKARFGSAQFWHDKHHKGTFVSDAAKERIETTGITGVHFSYRDQA